MFFIVCHSQADQIPPLLQSIAAGQREFTPSPSETKEVCRRMYRARSTLLVKFENDDLDESEGIEKVHLSEPECHFVVNEFTKN